MQTLQPGTVVLVDLDKAPGPVGREQQKYRPCLVMVHWPPLQLLIIVPISGGKPPVELYTTVPLRADRKVLIKDSFALCHQLRVVSEERLRRTLGRLNALDLEKVRAVVKGMMNL